MFLVFASSGVTGELHRVSDRAENLGKWVSYFTDGTGVCLLPGIKWQRRSVHSKLHDIQKVLPQALQAAEGLAGRPPDQGHSGTESNRISKLKQIVRFQGSLLPGPGVSCVLPRQVVRRDPSHGSPYLPRDHVLSYTEVSSLPAALGGPVSAIRWDTAWVESFHAQSEPPRLAVSGPCRPGPWDPF